MENYSGLTSWLPHALFLFLVLEVPVDSLTTEDSSQWVIQLSWLSFRGKDVWSPGSFSGLYFDLLLFLGGSSFD